MSLKVALERLLDGPCYHGVEVLSRPSHVAAWTAAGHGEPVDWQALFDGFQATVDWPAASFWQEISAAFPESIIVLSTRDSAESWWKSVSETILQNAGGDDSPVTAMYASILHARFTTEIRDAEAVKAAYERHNAHVRATAPGGRLVEWTPADGWDPLCAALGVPVPDEPFPRLNTTNDWDRKAGPEAFAAAGAEWSALIEEFMPHVRDDTPADDPRVRALVERWDAVGAIFHRGDERRMAIAQAMLRQNREELGRRLGRSPEQMEDLFGYLDRARRPGVTQTGRTG